MNNTINPFKEVKRTNWAKKTQDRLKTSPIQTKTEEESQKMQKIGKPITKEREVKRENKIPKTEKKTKLISKKIKRRTKSFKIYPGKISREFDKRVNKLQVHFDDKDFDKDYVDSGKYLMFLMSFAEKFKIYELYENVDDEGNINIDKNKVLMHFKK